MTQELSQIAPPDTRIQCKQNQRDEMRLQTFDMRSLPMDHSWLDESEIPAWGKEKKLRLGGERCDWLASATFLGRAAEVDRRANEASASLLVNVLTRKGQRHLTRKDTSFSLPPWNPAPAMSSNNDQQLAFIKYPFGLHAPSLRAFRIQARWHQPVSKINLAVLINFSTMEHSRKKESVSQPM